MAASKQKNLQVLVTGGAGFIGSFLVDALIKKGYRVTILDNLEEQVHHGKKPAYLNKKAIFIKGDIRDYKTCVRVLKNSDIVYHLASAVGVGQSQYEIKRYTEVNIGGTANILDAIVNEKLPIKKIIFPGSMTMYGEGNYLCRTHGAVRPGTRLVSNLKKRKWEPICPKCNKSLKNIQIDEDALSFISSVYAWTKRSAEELIETVGTTYNIPFTILRFFNVYGPRQSLSNPYTGVSAIFLSRIKNGHAPVVYEDGLQSRDFISVHDVVRALILSMGKKADYEKFNVGSGTGTSVKDIALILAKLLKSDVKPHITGKYRPKDIRHCVADVSKARKILGWKPEVSFERGCQELISWAEKEAAVDSFEKAGNELAGKRLLQ